MAVTVTALDGRTWTVRRQWAPRHASMAKEWLGRRRAKRRAQRGRESDDPRWWEWFDVFWWPDGLDELLVAAVAIAVIVALVLLGVPFLLALIDLALVLLLFAGGVVARLVFRRPWTVEARSSAGDVVERQVVGWRRAGEEVTALAQQLRINQARR